MAQQENSQDGMAVLSMHQPWASLLVHGELLAAPLSPPPPAHSPCVITVAAMMRAHPQASSV